MFRWSIVSQLTLYILLYASISSASSYYSVVDIGSLGGSPINDMISGFNNKRQVVGASNVNNYNRAFMWENGINTDLGTLGGPSSYAYAINDNGQIVGRADTDGTHSFAFLYSKGQMIQLPSFYNAYISTATSINNNGDISGTLNYGGNSTSIGFKLTNNGYTDLGLSAKYVVMPTKINNKGNITGYSDSTGFTYINGIVTVLSDNKYTCYSYDINDSNHWVGYIVDNLGYTNPIALFNSQDIGSLGGGWAIAYGINNLDHVVGTSMTVENIGHAFIYKDGVMTDVNTLIDPASGWEITKASKINDNGDILAGGMKNGEYRNIILIPPDLTPPVISILSSPPQFYNKYSGLVAFSVNETSTSQCSFNGLAVGDCLPNWHFSLDNGKYTFQMIAQDTAGNVSTPATVSFTINTGLASSSEMLLPQTGQTSCYDASGNEINCTGTGQDGDLQVGLPLPVPRFTDNGDGTITDNYSGLVWLQKVDCYGNSNTWSQSLSSSNLLSNGTCGLTDQSVSGDWRLPNIVELTSIMDYQQSNSTSWLSSAGFTGGFGTFASSTTDADSAGFMFNSGKNPDGNFVSVSPKNNGNYSVWPVKESSAAKTYVQSGQNTCWDSNGDLISCNATGQDGQYRKGVAWPTNRFTIIGETLADMLTGLIWSKDTNAPGPDVCSSGMKKDWNSAFDYIKCLNKNAWQGYSDWRLPNAIELQSLSNRQQSSNINWLTSEGFDNLADGPIWTSTSYVPAPNNAWVVGSHTFDVSYASKQNYLATVWPVRGGYVYKNLSVNINGSGTVFTHYDGIKQNETSTTSTTRVAPGTTVTLIAANTDVGYDFSGWLGDCTIVSKDLCRISMDSAKTITATFTRKTYPINGESGGHGNVSCDSPVAHGTESVCTIISDAGYHLNTLRDNGATRLTWINNNKYIIKNVTNAHTVVASFAINPIVINNAAVRTSNPSVNLTLTYDGAVQMQFLIDNAKSWTKLEGMNSSKTIKLPDVNGLKTVYVRFVLNDGSISPICSASIFLETIAPTGTITINSGEAATADKFLSLQLTVSDSGGGPALMRLSEDGKSWTDNSWIPFEAVHPYTLGTLPEVTTPTTGVKKVFVQYKDGSGKLSKVYSDFINYLSQEIDSGTSNTISINGGADFTKSKTVTLTLTPPEGKTYVKLSNDIATISKAKWILASTINSWNLTSGDGIKTIYAQYSADKITPTSTYNATITLDTIAPTGWLLINNGASVTGDLTATVTLTMGANDANGVDKMCVKETSAVCVTDEFVDYASNKDGYPHTFSSTLDGKKTLFVSFKDNAGNVSKPVSASIILDTTKPTGCGVKINGGKLIVPSQTVNLALTAENAVSMQLSFDANETWGEWESYTKTKIVTLPVFSNGAMFVMVKYRDYIGNVTGPVSAITSLLYYGVDGTYTGTNSNNVKLTITIASDGTVSGSGDNGDVITGKLAATTTVGSYDFTGTVTWTGGGANLNARLNSETGIMSGTFSSKKMNGTWTVTKQ